MKSPEIRRVLMVYGVFVLLGTALPTLLLSGSGQEHEASKSFVYGLLLFSGNLVLLMVFARRLFDAAGEGTKGNPVSLGFLFLAKYSLLALGTYIGLVALKLSVLWFVAGIAAGLSFITVASFTRTKTA